MTLRICPTCCARIASTLSPSAAAEVLALFETVVTMNNARTIERASESKNAVVG